MAVNKRAAGADKEQLAARYLVDNGYTVLERNFRNKTGEIDIIAKKDNYIVFVEVKYGQPFLCKEVTEEEVDEAYQKDFTAGKAL